MSSKTAAAAAAAAPYEDVAKNAQLFMDTVQDLHRSSGTKFAVPIMGGKALDLHRLFLEVTARGGLQKVIRNRQWKEIIAVFDFPTTITNASFVLRKYYFSLLYQYEQVYYFRKQGPTSVQLQVETTPTEEKSTSAVTVAAAVAVAGVGEMWTGRWVTGSIDEKFENGYVVTVSFGSEKLKGVLYHAAADGAAPLDQLQQRVGVPCSTKAAAGGSRRSRNRKRARLAARDPSHPKPSRSGYNFFYSEHYARLKSLHRGQEKTISTRIAHLWSILPDSEKQVYQEQGVQDKQRYQLEMVEYQKTSGAPKTK
ncbi:hypothetical protein ACHQM5_025443 [Ranunculus cassubicifolius]